MSRKIDSRCLVLTGSRISSLCGWRSGQGKNKKGVTLLELRWSDEFIIELILKLFNITIQHFTNPKLFYNIIEFTTNVSVALPFMLIEQKI